MVRFLLAMLFAISCALAPQEEKKTDEQPPTSQPASKPAARTRVRRPEQARILEELLRGVERSRPPVIRSEDPSGKDQAASPRADEHGARLFLEGTPLMDRPGWLVVHGDRSEFRFKGYAPGGDTPLTIEINKSELLQAMEDEAAAGVKEFIISAEVTRYRGRNYLNLHKYRRQISHGNLGP